MTARNVVPLNTRSRILVTPKATDLMPEALCAEDQELVDNEITALEIGSDVLHMRTAAGLTQAALAQMVGTDQTTISRLESGRGGHVATIPKLKKIAKACGFGYDHRRAFVRVDPVDNDNKQKCRM